MQASLYPAWFGPLGIDVITPQGAEQDEVHHIYMNESSCPASFGKPRGNDSWR